jgi:hypothetical protein
MIRDIFVTERAGTPFRSSLSKGRKPEQRLGTFFSLHRFYEVRRDLLSYRFLKQPSILYTVPEKKLTVPSPAEFLVTLCIPELISVQK